MTPYKSTIASKVPGDEGKAGHTELPWRVHPYMSLRVVDQNDITIAGTGTDSAIRDQWEANARFIVRACNAHTDLLAALEEAATELAEAADKFWVIYCNTSEAHPDKDFMKTMSDRSTAAAAKARAALSRAEGA